jgi:hypothetical protein
MTAQLEAPWRNPLRLIRLRFRDPEARTPASVTVNGKRWTRVQGEWVELPGEIGSATVVSRYRK